MQNNYIRYIKGCLIIRLGGDYLERFFNMCRLHDIDLWNIKKENETCMCEVYAADFKRLVPFLRKTGTRARVVKKSGLPFYFPFLKKRIIFFIGVAACLAMLNFVTDYVWAIEYIGNLQISDDEMTDFLKGQNIHYGVKKESIHCEEEEKNLRERFENVTWTSIYFEGTKLYVEVKENEKSEPAQKRVKGTDIVANEGGVITSIITRNGVPKVKAGDSVEAGDVLVSGSVPIYDENQLVADYHVYDADADIMIRTPLRYKDTIKKSYPVICYTGNDIRVSFLEMFGRHIDAMPVFELLDGKKERTYETVTEKEQLVLLDNIYLPVYYGKISKKEYYIRYMTYTQEEMEARLLEQFEKFIFSLDEKGVQIVEKDVKIVENKDGMEINGDLLVIKTTGENVDITVTAQSEDETIKE